MQTPKLFMLLLGCKPKGRNTEQHDTLFAIGNSLKDLVPQIEAFWPDAGKIHIDGFREVNTVDGFMISIIPAAEQKSSNNKLFFLNLGGYKENEFDEFHYKMLAVAGDKAGAVKQAKQTAFYKHTGYKSAESHIDEKYGVDVDDFYDIADILPQELKKQYAIQIEEKVSASVAKDKIHLGYFQLKSL